MGFALPRISWRERAPELPDPPGVVPLKLPQAIDAIGWAFTWGCIGFLLYFTWASASDHAVALQINQFLGWQNLGLKLWLPLVIPYTVISIAVPILVKYGLPMFMEFDDKKPGQGFPKWWTFVLILGGSLVIIAGSVVVQNDARVELNRGGAVRVEQVNQNRAALQANLDSINADLKDITNPALTTYQAQAAREGAEAWAKRVATAKAQNDYQADAIERALAAAERGDQLRKDRAAAIQALAAAPTQASAVERVVKQGDSATAFADFIKEWRSVLLAIISDLGAVFCTWLALRLMALRIQQLADWHAVHSAPVPEAGIDTLAIEDHSDEWQIQPQHEQRDEHGRRLVRAQFGYNKDGTPRYIWQLAPGEKKRSQEEADALASAKDAGKRNPKDSWTRNESMFDGLSEGEQNPQSEVSDGRTAEATADADIGTVGEGAGGRTLSDGDLPDGFEVGDDQRALDDEAAANADASGQLDEGVLTHAEEDQQAESELSSEEELRSVELAASIDQGGFDRDEGGTELVQGSEAGLADEGEALNAPLSSPDEQALWTEATETEEPANDGSETRLPDGEGVVVWDDETDPTIKELLRKTEAAE